MSLDVVGFSLGAQIALLLLCDEQVFDINDACLEHVLIKRPQAVVYSQGLRLCLTVPTRFSSRWSITAFVSKEVLLTCTSYCLIHTAGAACALQFEQYVLHIHTQRVMSLINTFQDCNPRVY